MDVTYQYEQVIVSDVTVTIAPNLYSIMRDVYEYEFDLDITKPVLLEKLAPMVRSCVLGINKYNQRIDEIKTIPLLNKILNIYNNTDTRMITIEVE